MPRQLRFPHPELRPIAHYIVLWAPQANPLPVCPQQSPSAGRCAPASPTAGRFRPELAPPIGCGRDAWGGACSRHRPLGQRGLVGPAGGVAVRLPGAGQARGRGRARSRGARRGLGTAGKSHGGPAPPSTRATHLYGHLLRRRPSPHGAVHGESPQQPLPEAALRLGATAPRCRLPGAGEHQGVGWEPGRGRGPPRYLMGIGQKRVGSGRLLEGRGYSRGAEPALKRGARTSDSSRLKQKNSGNGSNKNNSGLAGRPQGLSLRAPPPGLPWLSAAGP